MKEKGFWSLEALIVICVLLTGLGLWMNVIQQAEFRQETAQQSLETYFQTLQCSAWLDALNVNQILLQEALPCTADESKTVLQQNNQKKEMILINSNTQTWNENGKKKISVGKNDHYRK